MAQDHKKNDNQKQKNSNKFSKRMVSQPLKFWDMQWIFKKSLFCVTFVPTGALLKVLIWKKTTSNIVKNAKIEKFIEISW